MTNPKSNKIIDNGEAIANTFNDFFTDVGKNLAEKIPQPTVLPSEKTIANSIFFEPTNKIEVVEVINTLKPKKAPGIDNIKSETLKKIAEEIAAPFTHLVNKIIETGKFPSVFKTAIIKPLHKNGDCREVTNYRPISLITNLAKVVEKIIKIRIVKFLEKYNVISDRQFGFRSGKSTQDAISSLTNEIYKAMDLSKPTLCVFLDLKKAFDTVSHSQLLKVLHDIGFRNNAYNLMESYLSQRKQYVKVNNFLSNERLVEYGVPQGTVLGPILFIIYLNSLLAINSSGVIISYADDTAIFYSDDTWVNLKLKVENDIINLINWLNYKKLTINYDKTKFLPFSIYKNSLPSYKELNISINNNPVEIKAANSIKYLGVTIDSHLRWDLHVSNTTKTLRSILYKFKYLKSILEVSHLKILYYALVESRLSYGILGWGGVADCHLKQLEVIQKKFLKIMLNKENTYPSNLLYTEAQILNIRKLYILSIAIKQFRTKTNLTYINHPYMTRLKTNDSVKTTTASKSITQKSYSFLAPRLHNYLPSEIKNIQNLNLFKKKIKVFILHLECDVIQNLIYTT